MTIQAHKGEPLETGAKRKKKKKAPAAWMLLKRGDSAIMKKKLRFHLHVTDFCVVLIFKQKIDYFCDFFYKLNKKKYYPMPLRLVHFFNPSTKDVTLALDPQDQQQFFKLRNKSRFACCPYNCRKM